MNKQVLFLAFLALVLFGCRFQCIKTGVESRKPCVEIRLEYAKNLDNKPIEIILERKGKEYSKKISNGQLNYSFYNLKSGKYLILLAFQEDGEKPYKEIYGFESYLQEGIDIDTNGEVYSTFKVLQANKIKVYRNRHTIVDLHIDFKKNTVNSKPPATQFQEIIGEFFRVRYFVKKEMKSYYYKLYFQRSYLFNNIDKKKLEKMEKIRQEFKKKKEDQ